MSVNLRLSLEGNLSIPSSLWNQLETLSHAGSSGWVAFLNGRTLEDVFCSWAANGLSVGEAKSLICLLKQAAFDEVSPQPVPVGAPAEDGRPEDEMLPDGLAILASALDLACSLRFPDEILCVEDLNASN